MGVQVRRRPAFVLLRLNDGGAAFLLQADGGCRAPLHVHHDPHSGR